MTKSCGCLQKEKIRLLGKSRKKHGHKVDGIATPEYGAWRSMKVRCYDKNSNAYKDYGARGIAVCNDWRDSFESFIAAVGSKPKDIDWSLGRINNNGNYEPGNVRWETKKQQDRNRRSNTLITAFEKTQTLSEWAEQTGIKRTTISMRLNKYGFTPEEALTKKQSIRKQ
mgnify:FL=1